MTSAPSQRPPAQWPRPARICARCRLILPAHGVCACPPKDARVIGLDSLLSGHQLETLSERDVDSRLRQRRGGSGPWTRPVRRAGPKTMPARARGVIRGVGVMPMVGAIPRPTIASSLELLDAYHGQALAALRLSATVGFVLEGGPEPIYVPAGAIELLAPARPTPLMTARTELYSALTAGGALVRRIDGHMASLALLHPDDSVIVYAAAFTHEPDDTADPRSYRETPPLHLVARPPIAVEPGRPGLRAWFRRSM